MTTLERFMAKVMMLPDAPGCWLWTASVKADSFGYGQFSLEGRPVTTHRASWRLHFGEIPNGVCVLHRCDVPLCVNPDHLFLGTQVENVSDMDAKGRAGRATLTNSEVHEIRSLRGKATGRSLAVRFSVSPSNISNIQLRRTWASLPSRSAQEGV